MKLCKVCNQEKPFDPTQPKGKPQGFMGKVCWDCYVVAQRHRAQGLNPKDPESVALWTQIQSLKQEARKAKQNHMYLAQAQRIAKLILRSLDLNHEDVAYQSVLAEFAEQTKYFPSEVTVQARQYLEKLLEAKLGSFSQ